MGTIATPPTFGANGNVPTTYLNQMRDILNALLNPPICEVIQTVAQSIPNAGTALLWDTEIVDTDGMHSTTTNTSRVTIQTPGRYLLGGAVCFTANATGRRGSWWSVNGVALSGGEAIYASPSAGNPTTSARMRAIYLNAGDYLELFAFQDSGGALATSVAFGQQQASMTARWIGSA